MIGAIAGDIVGSAYEGSGLKRLDFPLFGPNSRFTDDSVLTVAVAAAILSDGEYLASIRQFGIRYPSAGYGGAFLGWLIQENPQPYNSWGNGSAMRVSPVGFAATGQLSARYGCPGFSSSGLISFATDQF